MSSASNRLRSLDGLRGLAAVVVVVHHSLLVLPTLALPYFTRKIVGAPSDPAWWLTYSPLHLLWDGPVAVYVFFILSGFVLTLPVLRAVEYSWSGYYPARLVRLMLPVAAAVVFAAVTIALVPRVHGEDLSEWMNRRSSYSTPDAVLRDLLLVFDTSGAVSPLWSLRWELLFSLLLPAYVVMARSIRRAWWLLPAASVLLIGGATYFGDEVMRFMPMFAIGVWAAVERDRITDWAFALSRSRWSGACWAGLLMAAALLLSARWMLAPVSAERWVRALSVDLNVLGAALTVFCALPGGVLSRVLEIRPLQFFGRISYSLYLVHEPIVIGAALLLPAEHRRFVLPVALVLSPLVAAVFHRFVEVPSQRLSSRVRRRMSAPRPAEGPVAEASVEPLPTTDLETFRAGLVHHDTADTRPMTTLTAVPETHDLPSRATGR